MIPGSLYPRHGLNRMSSGLLLCARTDMGAPRRLLDRTLLRESLLGERRRYLGLQRPAAATAPGGQGDSMRAEPGCSTHYVRLAREKEMRTMMIILGGFVLLGLSVLAGRLIGGAGAQPMIIAAKVFIPIWLVAALLNMWVGVTRAGYSVAEELPIFLLIFALPAAGALLIWWKLS
jgi:hypothetical protein